MAYPTESLLRAREFQVKQEEQPGVGERMATGFATGAVKGGLEEIETRKKSALEEASDKRKFQRDAILQLFKDNTLVQIDPTDPEKKKTIRATPTQFAGVLKHFLETGGEFPEGFGLEQAKTHAAIRGQEGLAGLVEVTEARAAELETAGVVAQQKAGKLLVPARFGIAGEPRKEPAAKTGATSKADLEQEININQTIGTLSQADYMLKGAKEKTSIRHREDAINYTRKKGLDPALLQDFTFLYPTAQEWEKAVKEKQSELLTVGRTSAEKKVNADYKKKIMADAGKLSGVSGILKPSEGAVKNERNKAIIRSLTGKDKTAYEWAVDNPQDPKADEILQGLGLK